MPPELISIVIPAYNEEENVVAMHSELRAHVADCPTEIIFVDDGSTDNTAEEIRALQSIHPGVRLLLEQKRIEALEQRDLLLRLNLVAVHAVLSSELRFLDAINYWYERLPQNWTPRDQYRWLGASLLAIFARALARTAQEVAG